MSHLHNIYKSLLRQGARLEAPAFSPNARKGKRPVQTTPASRQFYQDLIQRLRTPPEDFDVIHVLPEPEASKPFTQGLGQIELPPILVDEPSTADKPIPVPDTFRVSLIPPFLGSESAAEISIEPGEEGHLFQLVENGEVVEPTVESGSGMLLPIPNAEASTDLIVQHTAPGAEPRLLQLPSFRAGSQAFYEAGDRRDMPTEHLPTGKAFTLSFWALMENHPDGTERQTLLEVRDAANYLVLKVRLHAASQQVDFHCGYKNGSPHHIHKKVAEYFAYRWVHWAFIRDVDAGFIGIYRDGELVHQGASTDGFEPLKPASSALIGAQTDGQYPFYGKLADLRLWEVAQSAKEIRQGMYGRLDGTESGLKAYYPFSENY